MQTGKLFVEKEKDGFDVSCRCTIDGKAHRRDWNRVKAAPVRRKRLSWNWLTKSPARWKCRFRRRRNYSSAPNESDAALSQSSRILADHVRRYRSGGAMRIHGKSGHSSTAISNHKGRTLSSHEASRKIGLLQCVERALGELVA